MLVERPLYSRPCDVVKKFSGGGLGVHSSAQCGGVPGRARRALRAIRFLSEAALDEASDHVRDAAIVCAGPLHQLRIQLVLQPDAAALAGRFGGMWGRGASVLRFSWRLTGGHRVQK